MTIYVRAVVAVAAAVAAASASMTTPAHAAQAGGSGTVIAATPTTAYGLPGVALPARAWHILYWSRTAEGGPVQVSGTVLVPNLAWNSPGPRPLVGFAVGTQGLADRCAPSAQLAAGTEYESAVLVQMLLRGWAVAMTDYQGLGTAGDHTYVIGPALGRDVLDSIRAARNIPATGLSRSGPLAIYGYSEGGGAAAWALQLQPHYAPDLRLSGGAVGAPAVDMNSLLAHVDGTPLAFLELYAAIGFNAAYPELRLGDYLNGAGRSAAQQLRNTCIEGAILEAQLTPNQMSHYVTTNPLTTPRWRGRIAENNLGFTASPVPTVIGLSQADEVFPFRQGQLLYNRWCARGTNAAFVTLPTPEHLASGVAFSLVGIPFLSDRFARVPLRRAATCRPVAHTSTNR